MSFFDSITDDVEAQTASDTEDSDAGKFDPAAGDLLQGVVLKVDLFTGGNYSPAITLTFRNVGEKEVGGVEPGKSGRIFLGGVVIKRKMMEAAPAIGSPFALLSKGKVSPESGGNSYKDWTLVTPFTRDGDAASHDRALWDSVDPDQRAFVAPTATAAKDTTAGDWF